jgi:hypothetical protein
LNSNIRNKPSLDIAINRFHINPEKSLEFLGSKNFGELYSVRLSQSAGRLLVLAHEDLNVSRFFGQTASRIAGCLPESVAALPLAGFSDRFPPYILNQRSNLKHRVFAVKLLANHRIAFSSET